MPPTVQTGEDTHGSAATATGHAAPGQLEVGEAISYGWNAFKKYAGPLVIIALVIGAINFGFSLLSQVFNDSAFLVLIVQVASFLVSVLLALGFTRAVLKVTAGQEPEVGDLFQTDHYGPYLGASILFGLMVGIGLVIFIVPGIIALTFFFFYSFAIVDRGDGVMDSLSRSAEITKGQRGSVFLLGLACFGINLVGAILCGVGLLVTYPLTLVAASYAYRTLSGQPSAPVEA